jgi:hypothetical protein
MNTSSAVTANVNQSILRKSGGTVIGPEGGEGGGGDFAGGDPAFGSPGLPGGAGFLAEFFFEF